MFWKISTRIFSDGLVTKLQWPPSVGTLYRELLEGVSDNSYKISKKAEVSIIITCVQEF